MLDYGVKILYATRVMISKKLIIVIIAFLFLAAVPSYYFYTKYQKSQMLLKNPTEAAKAEVKALTARVGALIELPNEEPTVATISDKEKLKDQPFFAKSENGDKVLIYTQARKAILYRPSINKIIEVSSVNLGQASPEAMPAARGGAAPSASPSAQTTTSVKVAIYNGTTTVGLTSKIEKQLKATIPNLDVVAKENAKKKDYEKTIVVVLSQGRTQEAKAVAEFLGASVAELPQGEVKPATLPDGRQADILVILGSDKK